MFKFVMNNLSAKIFCLLLAAVAWIYVAQGAAKVANFPGGLSLTLRNTPVGLVAITDTDRVEVKISAERSVWNKLSSDSFLAYVDLTALTQGTHELTVQVNCNVAGVQIVEINAAKVLVRIEPIASKKVGVKIKIVGSAGEGLVAGEAKITPEEVELTGAKTIIDKILEANAIITLSGETSDVNKTVPLVALDSDGEIIKNINFSPVEVQVALPVVKAGTSKTVGIKTKIRGRVKNGYWVSSIVTNPETITIAGPAGVLTPVTYIETSEVDIDGLESDKTYSIDLNLPSGVSLVEDLDKVQVQIHLSTIDTQKEITAGFNWQGLLANLSVTDFSSKNVKVVVTGSAESLSALSSSNVFININMQEHKVAGVYSIDINKDNIIVPDGVGISSFVPSSITVTLANK